MSLFGYGSGCCPCTNCVVAVPEDKWYAVQWFGKYSQLLTPGLHCLGCDCLGKCITLGSISKRVQERRFKACSKTKDAVFTDVQVAVQYAVRFENAEKALYGLTNVEAQLQMFAGDVLRSSIADMTLEEAFQRHDGVAEAVSRRLKQEMEPYGIDILRVLVTEIMPDKSVVEAMNRIQTERYLRAAAYVNAQAKKLVAVKGAEGDADATHMQGLGIARMRGAILDGLRETVGMTDSGSADPEHMSTMLLLTQSMETLSNIASSKKASVVFIPQAKNGGSAAKGAVAAPPPLMKMSNSDSVEGLHGAKTRNGFLPLM
eukprot:CAMPEP_0206438286 /NCGR_PEP_ID=MMETSP0324_2-20121206/11540_1 /ASSEMBLY_ACC=CAM_ASM_000836 /TAXON_ID=2866 /ORGANISM="Crypthecodinium cohnii, Strain Seligo" /LENGTH=315 /DNA_ID=CAMNT_0053905717 /DNA_START=53 /DNA_END=998 /DNA_ORIENTATION=+